jgi:hypothetical protein
MKHCLPFLFLTCVLVAACNPSTPAIPDQPTRILYTSFAEPWLADLYACAGENPVLSEQAAADYLDPQSVDLTIRIGQSTRQTLPTYQIGSEELLVIVNPQNPVAALTIEQVRGLFSGQTINWQDVSGSSALVQVWVFAAGEDIQQVFNSTILDSSPVTSTARLATSPDEMMQAVAKDVNAAGILTRHWKTETVKEVLSFASVPVLAITPGEPQGTVLGILDCMQK